MKNNPINIILFIIVIITFWCYNHWLPNVMDDECYSRIYPSQQIGYTHAHCLEPEGKIKNYTDVWISQINHYNTINGRAPIHILAQCFLGIWGQTSFDIINPIILVVFLFCLSMIVSPSCDKNNRIMSMMALGLAFIMLVPEPTAFYNGIDYSLNYLWSSTSCLVFICWAFREKTIAFIPIVLQCFVALFAGWSHESFVIPVGAGIIYYVCLRKFRLTPAHWALLISFCLGAVLLVFSPSNINRAGGTSGSGIAMFHYLRASKILLIVLILLLFKYKSKVKDRLKDERMFFVMWLISILFVIFINIPNQRSLIGVDFFACLFLFRLIYPTIQQYRWIVPTCGILFVVCMIYIAPYQYAAAKQYHYMHSYLQNTETRECVVAVEKVNIPWWIKRYVCQYQFNEEWYRWEEEVFELAYDKDDLLIFQTDSNERSVDLEDYFTSDFKFPGNNPFYHIGNYLYCQDNLSASAQTQFVLDEYISYDIISTIRNPWRRNCPLEYKDLALEIKPFEFQGKTYYRAFLEPFQFRKIKAINIK